MTKPLSAAEQALRDAALDYHCTPTRGKISVTPTKPLFNQRDLSLAYSPGVAYACLAIEENPALASEYTSRANLVGVVTNGTAVLGLGDIGPLAGKPVMEGKGCLFKKFAGIDVFDIELAQKDPDKLIEIIAALEPTLGGVNLEDIKAPECFYIERALKERMKIPVFHDDQHGTAIISAAALLNGLELVGKDIGAIKLVASGAGAAAIACLDVMVGLGVSPGNIFVVDSRGVLQHDREDVRSGRLDESKRRYCQATAARTLADVCRDADVFLGCSAAGVLTAEMVATMAARPIILALANPEPEIRPELARQAKPDCIVATGRSDYPNQVNNVLCFPYIFRGALDCGATRITDEMKLACVREIAALAKEEISDEVAAAYAGQDLRFGPEYIIPKPFDSRLILRIAPAVARAAEASGVATRPIRDLDAYRQSLARFVYQTSMVMRPLFSRRQGRARARGLCRRRGRARAARRPGGARRAARRPDAGGPAGRDRHAHRARGPAHPARRRLRGDRSRGRSAVSRLLGALPPADGPQRRDARDGEGRAAAFQHADRRDAGAARRGRRDAHRTRRALRRPPRARPRRDRAQGRGEDLRGDERGAARQPHAVHRRHFRQRRARRRRAGRDRADGGRGGAPLRPAAEGRLRVALDVRLVAAALGAADARRHRAVQGTGPRRRMRRRAARRRRAVPGNPRPLPARRVACRARRTS